MRDWIDPEIGLDESHETRTLIAQHILAFARQHPGGISAEDLKKQGLPLWPIRRLVSLRYLQQYQIPERKRGPRCFRFMWKPAAGEGVLGD